MLSGNIFRNLPEGKQAQELFEELACLGAVKIERIVSAGHASPEGFWYDQEQHEWVLLLRGGARLLFAQGHEAVELKPGDWINIPAHVKHRVIWTDPDQPTIWLAVHYR